MSCPRVVVLTAHELLKDETPLRPCTIDRAPPLIVPSHDYAYALINDSHDHRNAQLYPHIRMVVIVLLYRVAIENLNLRRLGDANRD